jgi:hypothetical protein
METVSLNLIEDIWNRLCDLDEKASAQLSKEFFKAQPALGIYCAAQNENLGKDGESSPMVELTIAIWQAMTQMAGRPIPMATPEEIEAAEEAITKRLEKLQEDSEMELQTHARGTIRNHNQREMLGFGVEILMQRYQEDPDLAPDSLCLEMLWLNTVVDCLDNLDPNVPRPQLEIPDLPDWPEPVPLGSEPAESD